MFRRKPAPDLIRGSYRFADKNMRLNRRGVMERRASGEVVETAREARQGYLDRPVLLVLVVSTALAVVVLGILYFSGIWFGRA